MIYKVKDIVGENAIEEITGEKLYEVIHNEITSGNLVELDFVGVRIYSATFFNFVIGQLLRDFTPSYILEILTYKAKQFRARLIYWLKSKNKDQDNFPF